MARTSSTLKFHPAADAFPLMDAERFAELKTDIEELGLREPITLHNGCILDGRNRYKACLDLGVEPQTREFDGDPWSFVWSLNGERRDLVAEQRYLIWRHCHEQSDEWQATTLRVSRATSKFNAGITSRSRTHFSARTTDGD